MWEVLKFISSPRAAEAFARELQVARQEVTYRLAREEAARIGPPSAPIGLDAFAYARPEPVTGDWLAIHQHLAEALAQAARGETEVGTALAAAVTKIEAALAAPVAG